MLFWRLKEHLSRCGLANRVVMACASLLPWRGGVDGVVGIGRFKFGTKTPVWFHILTICYIFVLQKEILLCASGGNAPRGGVCPCGAKLEKNSLLCEC